MSVPGLKVVAPATAGDAYGMMKAALREDGPVVYVDHKRLFPIAGEVPVAETIVPFGLAKIRRAGTDLTITTHSFMNRVAIEAADLLQADGISAEIVDLRSLAPLDIDTIVSSVRRTGALMTLEEGQVTCGVGVEVIARVQEALGPVSAVRVGALPAPVSSNPVLELACLPDASRVELAAKNLLRQRRVIMQSKFNR